MSIGPTGMSPQAFASFGVVHVMVVTIVGAGMMHYPCPSRPVVFDWQGPTHAVRTCLRSSFFRRHFDLVAPSARSLPTSANSCLNFVFLFVGGRLNLVVKL